MRQVIAAATAVSCLAMALALAALPLTGAEVALRAQPNAQAAAAPDKGAIGEAAPPSRPPVVVGVDHPPPLRLADAIRRSLANVQTVQANVAVQSATIGRFEALKQFVPLVSLP